MNVRVNLDVNADLRFDTSSALFRFLLLHAICSGNRMTFFGSSIVINCAIRWL